MTDFSTLSEMLLARRADNLHIDFIDGEQEHIRLTYGQFTADALACLYQLQQHGLEPGDELVIFIDSNQAFLTAFWAALLGGIVPIPVAVGISDEHRFKLFRILKQLRRPTLYSNDRLLERLGEFAATHDAPMQAMLRENSLSANRPAGSGEGKLHQAQPDDRAFIQYSSGSTSDPKGICLTHANLCSNVRAIVEGAAVVPGDRALSWMPLTHDMGLIGLHLAMVCGGVDHAIMDTQLFVRRPLLWLQKASELGSTVLCSPNFGYKHYLKLQARKGAGDIDLSPVRLIFNGAEPISVGVCDEFHEALAPHGLKRTAMFTVYGLAEATVAATFPEPHREFEYVTLNRHALKVGEPVQSASDDDPDAIRLVKVGTPVRDCEMRLCDDADRPVPDGHVGHIQLRGANVTSGIYGMPNEETGLFLDDGWMRTGDCGAIVDGQLVVTGRDKEIIIVNGQNYLPHDIEEAVAGLDGLELGKVVAAGAQKRGGHGEELLIFVLHRQDADSFVPVATRVREAVGALIGLEVDHVIPVPRVPKTTSGKLQRRALAEAYLAGEFDEVLAAQPAPAGSDEEEADPVLAELLRICAEFSKDRAIGPDDNLFEVGISSLTLTEIMLAIDEKYPGRADINDLFDHPTLRELAAFLQR